jgi:hypothetical protein
MYSRFAALIHLDDTLSAYRQGPDFDAPRPTRLSLPFGMNAGFSPSAVLQDLRIRPCSALWKRDPSAISLCYS